MTQPSLLSGREAKLAYSLSRWTDVPGGKWPWFRQQLAQGHFVGIDPRSASADRWSLAPEDTLGLLFWTKDPTNLIRDHDLLRPYRVKVAVTVTGWAEVEKNVPGRVEAAMLLVETARVFGGDNVRWRFSPVPLLPDNVVVDRFARIAMLVGNLGKVSAVDVSFLQPNDRVPETRTPSQRRALLDRLADVADCYGISMGLCAEDQLFAGRSWPTNLGPVVCAPPGDFDTHSPTEACGCALAVDPFGPNESCIFGCSYCYVTDTMTSPKKHSSTRRLPVLR